MRTHTQLIHIQRYQITALLKTGHSNARITKNIGVYMLIIGREIACNRGKGDCCPKQTHQFTISRSS